MRPRGPFVWTVVCALTALAPAWPADAATICVSPSGGGCETTIQDAVDLATGVDIITINKGRYDENVVVPAGKDGLTIIGKGGVIDADLPNTGVGLTIESNNVTLEKIEVQNGLDDAIRVGANGAPVTGVQIRGARIRNAGDDCIEFWGAGAIVEKSRFEGCNDRGILGDGGDNSVIRKNRFEHTAEVVDVDGNDMLIEKNKARFVIGDALDVRGDNMQVLRNSITLTDNDCIEFDGSNGLISRNKCTKTDGECVDASTFDINDPNTPGGQNNTVSLNKCSFVTTSEGFDIDAGTGLVIERNDFRQINQEAVSVAAPGAVIRDNRVRQAGARDHCFRLRSFTLFPPQFGALTVTGNSVDECGRDGFSITGHPDPNDPNAPAVGAVVTGNTVSRSFEDGIDVQGVTGGVISDNTATDNFGIGIELDGSVTNTTVANNSASGNREDYCDAGTGTIDGGGNNFGTTFDPMGGPCPVGD